MVSRVWYILVICVLLSTTAFSLSPPHVPKPPLPPLGWEEEITPGFEPSIESVLVNYAQAENLSKRNEHTASWGENAIPVLMRLSENPKWADYTTIIQEYIALLNDPPLLPLIVEQFPATLESISKTKQISKDDWAIIRRASQPPNEVFLKMVTEHFAQASAEEQLALTPILSSFNREHPMAILETCLSVARDDNVKSILMKHIHYQKDRERPHESMSIILNKERLEAAH